MLFQIVKIKFNISKDYFLRNISYIRFNWFSNGIISRIGYFSLVIRTLLNCNRFLEERNLACTHSNVYFSIAMVEQRYNRCIYHNRGRKNRLKTKTANYYYVIKRIAWITMIYCDENNEKVTLIRSQNEIPPRSLAN